MKKWYGAIGLLTLLCSLCAESPAQQPQYAFRVWFTDKNATAFSLSRPQDYLSRRALDRRNKYGIGVDSLDLPVPGRYLDSVLRATGGILHATSRWHNSCVLLSGDSAATAAALQQIAFVRDFKKVAYYAGGLHEKPGPADSSGMQAAGRPAAFDSTFYGAAWSQIHLCNGEYLHEQGNMGEGQLIAVIDVGFSGVNTAPAFSDLFAEHRLLDTWNYIYDTAHVFDYGAHGCQVLSCMAAYMPGTHVGTAPKALYALYATDDLLSEQSIEEDNFAAAAERADSLGADLISTSLGYNTFDDPADSYAYSDLDGHTTLAARTVNLATRKGIMVVASAGNEGTSTWHHILTPGDADSAMTVGSVNTLKYPAPTSGRGPNAAGALKPDACAQGVAAAVILPSGHLSTQSGTSFATPVLAGLTACLMQSAPEKTPLKIRSLIQSVADSFATPNNDIGAGVPDFRKAYDRSRRKETFSLYPNPARQEVRVLYNNYMGDMPLHYKLMDLQGRTLMQGNTRPGMPIRLGKLPQGMYLIRLVQGQEQQTCKLLIRP